jgi:hypothetical protein
LIKVHGFRYSKESAVLIALGVEVSTSSSSPHGQSYYLWYQFSFIVVGYFVLVALHLLMVQAKIVYVFYQQGRATNKFLQSNGLLNRRHYFRILALAFIDILLTLPLGIISAASQILTNIHNPIPGYKFPFYYGWAVVHSDWAPEGFSYSEEVGEGVWDLFNFYFESWASPTLALAIFALFGLTSEARATYWRSFCSVAILFGWTPPAHKNEDLGEIEFGARQLTMTERYALRPPVSRFSAYHFGFRSQSSLVASSVGALDEEQGYGLKQRLTSENNTLRVCASLDETRMQAPRESDAIAGRNSAETARAHADSNESNGARMQGIGPTYGPAVLERELWGFIFVYLRK